MCFSGVTSPSKIFLFAETQLSFVKCKEGDTGKHVIKYDVMNNMKPWNYRTEIKKITQFLRDRKIDNRFFDTLVLKMDV